MLRGEIWWVEFDPPDPPPRGKANNRRPAVIVSNDRANATAARLGRGVITVVPVTSNRPKVYPFQVQIPATRQTGLAEYSKAHAEQVRSVTAERMRERIGRLTPPELAQLDNALRLHLQL